jgi:multidrug efflux pump subunit AcrB
MTRTSPLIRHSRFLHLLSFLLIVCGIGMLWTLNREAFPVVTHDTIVVEARYPGASPEQIDQLLVRPLEAAVFQLPGIKHLHGTAVEGLGVLIAELDPDISSVDLWRTKIEQAIAGVDTLPDDLPNPPAVRDMSTRHRPILELALSGDLGEAALQDAARQLKQDIEAIPDVASVTFRGWRDRQLWVEVDPDALARYQLSIREVATHLKATLIDAPGGYLRTETTTQTIRIAHTMFEPAAIDQIVLRATPRGDRVRIGDVATTRWAVQEKATLNRAAGARAINLVVLKRMRGDAIRLVDTIHTVTDTFLAEHEGRFSIDVVNDLSFFIRRRLRILKVNGGIGLCLVMLTLFFFLAPRTALGASMGILIAGLTTVFVLGAVGASINLITMFGLIMVIGILVDEDLVIAENIHRHLEAHNDITTAVVEGTREIRRAIIATALTTMAVFLPLLFMGGTMGKFIFWIPCVVMIALSSSMLEALIILPAHLHFLASFRHNPDQALRQRDWFAGPRAWYERALRRAIAHRRLVMASGTLLVIGALGVVIAGGIPFHLFPKRGIEIFYVRAEAPIGTPLEETEQRFLPLETAIASLPPHELDTYTTQIGVMMSRPGDPFTTRGSHVGQIVVYLTPDTARARDAEAIIAQLRAEVGTPPGVTRLRFERFRHGPSGGKPIVVELRGPDTATLQQLALRVTAFLTKQPGVHDIDDGALPGKPELDIEIDPLAAARAGLSTARVGEAIYNAFQGREAVRVATPLDRYAVIVRLPDALRRDRANLSRVFIPNDLGRMIPLDAVAQPRERMGPHLIVRKDGLPVVTVAAEIDQSTTSVGHVMASIRTHEATLLADAPHVTIQFGGEGEETRESLGNLRIAALCATLLVFAILLATLHSIRAALIVLSTIPLGIVGIILDFAIEGRPLTFMALLGMIGMTGIIVDVAIIYLDMLRQRRSRTTDYQELIIATAVERFRPIVLVMLTTVLGIIPTAYGIGGVDPFIQPMALAMNWGLAVGTVLAIFWVPCITLAALGNQQLQTP